MKFISLDVDGWSADNVGTPLVENTIIALKN